MAIIPRKRSEESALAERTSDPFGYLRNEINRVFDDFWGESWLAPRESFAGFWPQVDVTETDKEVKVCAEIPGVDAKDIDVSVEDGTLTIKGEKKYEQEENEKAGNRKSSRCEHRCSPFGRCLERIETDRAASIALIS